MNAQDVLERILPSQRKLAQHQLYHNINDIEGLRLFMEGHIFAVWDFMSLLKSLQIHLSCVQTPWLPKGNPEVRHFINEIVLDEESDRDHKGNFKSHFEMYYEAMNSIGASTDQIDSCLAQLNNGKNVGSVIERLDIPSYVKDFSRFNFELISEGKPHKIAAAFTFGRENVIPDMFFGILSKLKDHKFVDLKPLLYYFQRHIELDGDEHGPIAIKMVDELCKTNQDWKDVVQVANHSLDLRENLWDGVLKDILSRKSEHA